MATSLSLAHSCIAKLLLGPDDEIPRDNQGVTDAFIREFNDIQNTDLFFPRLRLNRNDPITRVRQIANEILGKAALHQIPTTGTLSSIAQRIQDKNLVMTFTRITQQIQINDQISDDTKDQILASLPVSTGNDSQDATGIRTWMVENSAVLVQITELDLSGLGLTIVPPELSLLPLLEFLDLKRNPITVMPEEFNLTNLAWLDLSYTSISMLSFNAPNLQTLILGHSPIASMVITAPNLQGLDIRDTRVVLPSLHGVSNLEWIQYRASPLHREVLDNLRRASPNLRELG